MAAARAHGDTKRHIHPEASGKFALADWVRHWEAANVDLAADTGNRRAKRSSLRILPEFGGWPIG